MPDTQLSERLHAKLDAMGAPPRETGHDPVERLEDSQTAGSENLDQGEAMSGLDDSAGENPEGVVDTETETEVAETSGEVATDGKSQTFKPAELAEAIGWEAKDLYDDLMVPVGNDGETLSLGAIKDRMDTLSNSETEVNEARRELQARFEQLHAHQQQLTAGFAGVSEEVGNAQRKLVGIEAQYSAQPWEQLDAENPGQAANLRQKYSAAYGAAEAEMQQAQAHQAQVQTQSYQQMVTAENQRLVGLVPEWKDMNLFRTEEPQISEYLISMGFRPDQLQGMTAAAPRAVARDAWLYRQHLKKVASAKGQVRAAPKPVLRPGGGPGRKTISDKQTDQLAARARETGRASDRLAAARAIVGTSLHR